MKKFLLSVPLACCLAGCASATYNDGNAVPTATTSTLATSNTTTSDVATSPNAVVTNNTSESAATNSAAMSEASAASPATTASSTKKTYRVVEEGQPGMPPEVLSALKKAKVAPPPAGMKVPDKARVKLTTSKGDIIVELNGKAAPLHAKSFLYLSGKGFYNGTVFHRYEPGFVIQGGDPLSKNPKLGAPYASLTGSPSGFHGSGGPGYQVPREFNSLKHKAMVLSAARTSDPDSAGSQFYITLADSFFLDQENSQDGVGYTVFGQVLQGQNVVLKLRAGDTLKSATILK